MKSKHLLLTLLLALFVPWAAMAQSTLPVCNGTTTTTNVPIRTGYGTQSEFIYPASMLSDMEGGTISSVKFFSSATTTYNYTNNVTVYVEEVASATEPSSSWAYNQATATKVYEGTTLSVTNGELVITFSSPYQYNGGNLCFNIWAATSSPSVSFYYQDQSYTCAGWDWSITPPVTKPYRTGSSLPKAEFTYTPDSNPCKKPTLAEATLTQGNGNVASLTWTEKGEAEGWVLQYGTDNTFATGSYTERTTGFDVSGTTVTANLTGLTPEQKLYARVKPDCDTDGTKWSNVIEFKPTNAIPQTVCDGTAPGTTAATNGYIPVYGGYAENYNKDEFIIPATTEGMANMASGTISEMTFYLSSPADDLWGNALYRVFMKEVNESAFANNSYYGTDGATIVYEGALDGTHSTMTIEFTTDYEYNGGNLLIGIYEYYKGSWKSVVFDGIESTNGSMYKNNSTSLESITTGNLQNFIPKTTFTYLPSATPKPRNLQVFDISSSSATLTWEAPANATPTSYQYRLYNGINWTSWESTSNLSVDLNLSASTPYTFQLKAMYDGVGESDPIEVDFTTLDDCAYPTNLVATTTPGQGTKATLTWVKGYDEDAWVLEYATNNTFTEGLVTMTDGFTVEGNNVTANLTGLTAEQTYYARVKANCDGPTSAWSNVAEFTPTNYVDFPYNANATSATSYTPFYGGYAANGTHSRFIIPSTSLADLAGGTVKKLTFYSSATTADWGDATFKVYVAEVEASSFTSNPSTSTPFDWSDMTEVYSGSLSLANGEMVILLDEPFVYSGTKNLMIGFEETNKGTNATAAWYYKSGVSNSCAYAYKTSANATNFSTSRNSYSPKMTFNYLPTPYQKIAAINEGTIAAISAELTWTAPETTATITGYAYQYKLSSAAEWPTAWSNLAASATSVTLQPLTPGTSYDFQIKVLYGEHESAVNSTSFFTECAIVTAFPWKEDFEAYSSGDFIHPCWVNQHLSGDGSYLYSVVTESMGDNNTKKLKLNDQSAGTETMLRLPEMNLPGNDYQFVIDVYRNTSTYQENPYELEGIHVYVSTNGNLEGATELAYIPRHKDVSNSLIPAEEETGWYTYEIPVGISGNCYIILKGVNQWCTSIYMDNFGVEQIPTSARPKNLAYSNVTNHSATLSWTAGDAEQALWQIAYSKTSFDPNTASFDVTTVNTVYATANPYTFAGTLDAESTYYMYVRANCGTATEPDYGPWCRKGVSFTTLAATPAPSNFVASNPASEKVDMTWNAGGGDFESWELYYVASETAPEAPTATTTATVTNITTLPTTEEPYVLDELDPVSKYYAWIRAKHVWNNETTYSDWVALTGSYFETLDACPTPTDLVATNLTSVSADLSWVGSDDVESYTVQYRTAATPTTNSLFFEGFETYADEAALEAVWTVIDLGDGANTAELGLYGGAAQTDDYGFRFSSYSKASTTQNPYTSEDFDQYLISPELTVNGVLEFAYKSSYGTTDVFRVGYSSTTNDLSAFTWGNQINSASSWKDFSETMPAGTKYFAINYMGLYAYRLYIDDINIYESLPAGEWITAADDVTTQSYQLNNLTGGIKYDAHVKSNCTSGEYCDPISFTTLAEGNMVFTNATNDGKWGNSGNWAPAQLPVLTDEVILRANATIESGCVAEAKKINLNSNTLTIADGGQLKTDNSVTATVKKSITGYGAGNEQDKANYYLIGNPLSSTIYSSSTSATGMLTGNYDLYQWSRTSDLEWRNYEVSTFSLSNGTGYLYANESGVELSFTGTVKANNTDETKTPSYTAPSGQTEFSDWNLYANPFVCDAYLSTEAEGMAFYRINDAGDGFTTATGAIHPMEGIFVQATTTEQSFNFSRTAPGAKSSQLNMNLRSNNKQLDNAILVFGEGQNLGKFSFRQGSSKVYMPVEGNDYAALFTTETMGEMPVSFKAEENGTYTLSFTNEEVTFSYLHLIDNMTGADVDLLANPTYSFDARTTDYESRFRLVFATGSSVDGDSFGFINGMGNLTIFGIEGEATLQVIDVTGRMLSSETFSGSYEKRLNVAPGVYMLRLINGNDVKVQKMVVR